MRMFVRHYCRECGAQLTPFSKFEERTESPYPGKVQSSVLLSSYNNNHPDERIAWCFSCCGMRECRRLTEREIWQLYLYRNGVVTRPKRKKQRRERGKR